MVVSLFRGRVSTWRVYAVGALGAVLFDYDSGIVGAAILFIPRDLPLSSWQTGAVVSSTVFGAMLRARWAPTPQPTVRGGTESCWPLG
jgi:hypothetical protein